MGPIEIQVLSYNIHKGLSLGNRKFILDRIRDAIRSVPTDIVFLQEVVGEHQTHAKKFPEWPSVSQFEYMAHEIWPHFVYGKNAVYDEGHHGNAVLSRFPVRFSENVDVTMNRFEMRGLLHVIVEPPGSSKPLHVICLHLGLFEWDRKKQIEVLCERIASLVPADEPLIVAGDFNDWREQASFALSDKTSLTETFFHFNRRHARTFPSWLPVLKLDRIYFRGLSPVEVRCLNGPPWSDLSDHSALLAKFGLETPSSGHRT